MPIAAAAGLTPSVSERPVPVEPKVVIASRSDDGEDIDLASDPPSSRDMTQRLAPFAPLAPPISGEPGTRKRVDTPAAAPVMAPGDTGGFAGRPSSRSEAVTDPIPRRNVRRARTIAIVIGGACIVIAAIAGVQAWQHASSATSAAVMPSRDPAPPTLESPAPTNVPTTTATATPTPKPPTTTLPAPNPTPAAATAPSMRATPDPTPPEPIDTGSDDDTAGRSKTPGATPSWEGTPRAPRPSPAEPSIPAAPPPRPKFDPKRI
jgi:hypothetical protein